MTKLKPIISEAVDFQRESLNLALDEIGMDPVEDAWDDEVDSFVADMGREVRGRKEIDPALIALLVAWVTSRIADLTVELGKALLGSARATVRESLRSLNSFLKRLKGGSSPLDDDARVRAIYDMRAAQLASMRQATISSLGLGMNQRLRDVLMQAVPGEDRAGDIIQRVGAAIDGEWWRVERIVATETAFAYNEAQADGMLEVARQDPRFRGLLMRWTEKISDAGVPHDKRVAPDSIAMHAQLAPPGGMFIMPPDAAAHKISSTLLHRSWPFPPNRPHDRAVLTPWLPGLGQPGWLWRDGRKDMS